MLTWCLIREDGTDLCETEEKKSVKWLHFAIDASPSPKEPHQGSKHLQEINFLFIMSRALFSTQPNVTHKDHLSVLCVICKRQMRKQDARDSFINLSVL